ncbi:hypothetical protein BIZ78_gp098 [Erwinia phage vB_EamM_Caitlin]|uniref:hypothetical protein n=1 Tax=Erwinia phage vB_EamM_Caitlin TaxID=1883379 RepID=UPI00081CC03F|nr:hypothetical protein BIZ78_gp098 [Erwinia phage vB_EamM_Caitlin]ANZ48477.1 hypothetical protein CAITLIN_182 [Erwinia phage vB_EamM_Caitlin]
MSIREIASGEKVEGLVEAGTVQVSGKSTLEEVTAALAEKAEAEGAVAFRVTAAGGNNKMFGNAVYYVEA